MSTSTEREPAIRRGPGREQAPSWDSILRGRASVRQLQDRPVDVDLVRHCIEAAGWAPSPHGRQPWRFVVLVDGEAKERLATAMSESWDEQLSLDGQAADVIAIRKQKSEVRITAAPVVILPCLYLADLDVYPDPLRQEAERTMAVQSLGAAIQNLLLQAYALGLDTGWMCAPLFCPDVVCSALGLSPALIPQALIPLGYRAVEPKRRPRLSVDELIAHWE